MTGLSRQLVSTWVRLGPRFLPFADAASADLPLGRLLRLSLFQVSVGMALVLMLGTLNRVMIVELGVPASLVAVMIALPVLYAPARALIGFRSDHHRSALGWRRVPYLWMGTLVQFGGLAIMPFALLVLSGGGNAGQWPAWIGQAAAALAFLLVGAGLHTAQTAGLALANDLATPETRPRVVGLMYVMLLLGTIGSAVVFGLLLREFSPGRLVQVIQGAALATLVLNALAMWQQETRNPQRAAALRQRAAPEPDFRQAWTAFVAHDGSTRQLAGIGLGTLAFGMQDVLIEPYGGQVLQMSVGSTTLLTATLAVGGLLGFALASVLLGPGRGRDPLRLALQGVLLGVPAFTAVIVSAPWQTLPLFVAGVLGIGFAAGLFGHGTLTATMNRAPQGQTGLALGAWGAVQATAAGVGVALGGIMRDGLDALAMQGIFGAGLASSATGFNAVYGVEIGLLVATFWVLRPLCGPRSSVHPLGSRS